MRTCEAAQAQMLEYLYDLLDAGERQPLEAHLATCPACQGALQQARDQRSLLAAAARMEFPAVRFQPPVEEPMVLPAHLPATLPLPAARRPVASRKRWQRWAMAAAAVLAVGLGVLGARLANDYIAAEGKVRAGDAVVADARAEMKQAADKMLAAPREREALVKKAQDAIRERQIQVELTGPAAIVANTPTEFRVHTTNLNGQAAPANLTARVINDQGQSSAPLPMVGLGKGDYRLVVPAELASRPNAQLNLLVSANSKNGFPAVLNQVLPVAQPVYVTHLTTDKPMYQPGEIVHFRSLTLDRSTHRPAQDNLNFTYTYTTPTGAVKTILQGGNSLRSKDPWNGAVVMGPDGQPVHGVGTGMFLLAGDAPGGEYTLTVRDEQNRFPAQQRKFIVNNYQKPRLNKELDFNRKTYGPHDEVQALCKALRADGGPVKDGPVEVTVTVDGQTYDARGEQRATPIPLRTDTEGRVTVRFRLPAKIEKGQASVSVKFNDGGNVEAIVRPIPIVVKAMQVEFFPEGGDLVADLPNRVYFTARTPLGKPADLKGQLLEDGKPLAVAVAVQTLTDDREPGVNQGMGCFEFTPVAGRSYQLRIESPVGIARPVALPLPKTDGVVLRVEDGVLTARQSLKVQVHSTKKHNLLVAVSCRGQHVGSATLKEGETAAEIKLAERLGGVCKVTVYERGQNGENLGDLRPLAERLVYRQASDYLHVVIKPEDALYVPRDRVKLHLQTLTENEDPAPAVMMVAVVDKSVLTLADEKTARTLPTHFLLTSEVKNTEELEYADFLLGPHARAGQALDLLMGTHGWRRIVPAQPMPLGQFPPAPRPFPGGVHPGLLPPTPLLAPAAAGEQLVVRAGVPDQAGFLARQEAARKAHQEYEQQVAALNSRYEAADAIRTKTGEDAAYLAAVTRVQSYSRFLEQLRQTAVPVLAALLVLLLAVAMIANVKALKRALPFYALGAACAAILLVLVGLPPVSPPVKNEQSVAQRVVPPDLQDGPDALLPVPEGDLDRGDGAKGIEKSKGDKLTRGPSGFDRRTQPQQPPLGGFPVPTAMPPPMAPGQAGGDQKKRDKKDNDAEDEGIRELRHNLNEQKQLLEKQLDRPDNAPGKGGEGKDGKAPKGKDGKPLDAKADPAGSGANAQGDKDKGKEFAEGPLAGLRRQIEQQEQLKKERGGQLYHASMAVREYAHERLPGSSEVRSDFTETLYWHPVLVLPGGKTAVSFDLCDSVTSFQVLAYAHSLDGRLGASSYVVDSQLPFTLQPKIPLEVTASDRITVPLSVSNNTGDRRGIAVYLEENKGLNPLDKVEPASVNLEPETAARRLYRFQPNIQQGDAVLVYKGKTEGFAPDTVRTAFRVVPEGFPIVGQQSDMLEGSALVQVPVPASWVKSTLKVQAQVFPSTLADLQKGLEHLLREPHGCFEQTSTSNYPNLLILDYLRESDQVQPEIERRARELLARGYQKLTSFECLNTGKNQREGYEWFGGTAPAHEALTAYGLLQFRDMAKVQDVDTQMIQRTHKYLLSQRDGKGGFQRNQRALDNFGGAPEPITNAYIVWALTESGPDDDLATELKVLGEQAAQSKDPYFVSLVANSLLNRGKNAEAMALLKQVAALQQEDGHLNGETTSITRSGGRNLEIETTALAVLAWLKANNPAEFKKPLDRAIGWIGKQRGGYGGFGSTQSTILALKAVIAYTKANKRTPEAGELTLLLDNKPIATRKYPAGVSETLTLDVADAEKVLKPGANKLRLENTAKTAFPYTVSWSYSSLQPASAEGCLVRLSTKLSRTEVAEGDTVRLNVKLENRGDKDQGMATAIIGLPGGLTIPEDLKQLKEHIRVPEDGKRPTLSAFEIRGRELVLYWRNLAPKETIEVPVDLICRVPGEYSGPASRAYLYYNDDHKHWVEPLKVSIAAAK